MIGTSGAHDLEVGDVNHDGKLDVVVRPRAAVPRCSSCSAEMPQSLHKRVGFYRNQGGGLTWTLQVLATSGSHNVRVADIGRDGDIDIVGTNWSGASPVDLWENKASGGTGTLPLDKWTYKQVTGSHQRTFGLAFLDVDGDGFKDIASGPFWYHNPGEPSSSPGARRTWASRPS